MKIHHRLSFMAMGFALMATTAAAEPTAYPLTLQNCGEEVTFEKAPESAVTIGQSATEIMYALGLEDRVKGTSVWTSDIQDKFKDVDAKVERLAVQAPSFEAVVGRRPELVAAQWEWNVGPKGDVGTREQFRDVGIQRTCSDGQYRTSLLLRGAVVLRDRIRQQ